MFCARCAIPDGGFYAAQDADSEGVEGKFFVWRPEQLVRVLGNDAAQVVADYFGVTNEGNFEGMTVLNIPNPPGEVAARHSMSPAELDALIESASARLLEERSQRIPPLTDTKIITSWNGLMMGRHGRGRRRARQGRLHPRRAGQRRLHPRTHGARRPPQKNRRRLAERRAGPSSTTTPTS